jgi:uncharacterized protein (DUF2237 family)
MRGALAGGAGGGATPRVVLMATHEAVLEHVSLDDLKKHALDLA